MGKKQKKEICKSIWDRGRTVKCGLPSGHKGLHLSWRRDGCITTWRLSWDDTAIAKRELAARPRP